MERLGSAFGQLVSLASDAPGLPAARMRLVAEMARLFRGHLFTAMKQALLEAAVQCGPELAQNLTRETLHLVSEVSATHPVTVARPLATLVLQASKEASDRTGHGGFTDASVGEQIADFLPEALGTLDPRVVLDVIKYLAPLVETFAPPEAMVSVRSAATPVVEVCLAADPPALVVACGLILSLGLDDRWPLSGLLGTCMDHGQWSLAETLVDAAAKRNAAAAAPLDEAAHGERGGGDSGELDLGERLVKGAIDRGKFKQVKTPNLKLKPQPPLVGF
mmetsp:Transcript_29958/g.67183  ORF Transcript_29958/g.67183 Transcript_29958/m.67183 type:complete len:277 (-) Transcript_29958:1073-1903(-)